MNVSAHVRYLDYAVRPLQAKSKRRSGDDALPRRKAEPHPEDERPEDVEPSVPALALEDDDDGLGYSRHVPSRTLPPARKDMIAETVRPMPLQATAALLTLVTAGDGRSRTAVESAAVRPAPSRGDSFYDLLDQVIAQA